MRAHWSGNDIPSAHDRVPVSSNIPTSSIVSEPREELDKLLRFFKRVQMFTKVSRNSLQFERNYASEVTADPPRMNFPWYNLPWTIEGSAMNSFKAISSLNGPQRF